MLNKLKHINLKLVLSLILIVSILINMYSVSKIYSYRYEIGKQSYLDIEEIRQRNESNMDILTKSIENKSIKNEELLKLYKNYDLIACNIIELWQQYSAYMDNNYITVFSKNIETNKVIENDIYGKIKEYMLSTLNKEMKNEKSKLILEDEDLECFQAMTEMSKDIYDYFNEFYDSSLKGSTGKEKENKIIKRKYWIDILNGIYTISDNYVDIQWNIGTTESEEIN